MFSHLLFTLIGFFNRGEWEKDVHNWKRLNKKEKNLMVKLLIVLAVIFFVGIIAYFFIRGGVF